MSKDLFDIIRVFQFYNKSSSIPSLTQIFVTQRYTLSLPFLCIYRRFSSNLRLVLFHGKKSFEENVNAKGYNAKLLN